VNRTPLPVVCATTVKAVVERVLDRCLAEA
jgi:hypothetical protein